jgi:hypothetical protein
MEETLNFVQVPENNQELQSTPPQPQPQNETPPAAPTKKRGRPRKEEKKPDPVQDDAPKKEKSAADLFAEMKKDIDENGKGMEPEPGQVGENPIRQAARNIIDGYMLLTICDAFFPFILKMFFKKAKGIPDKEIRLSKDQKEHMAPIADEIAQGFLSFLDPVTLFFILQGAMYKQNLDDALQRREK